MACYEPHSTIFSQLVSGNSPSEERGRLNNRYVDKLGTWRTSSPLSSRRMFSFCSQIDRYGFWILDFVYFLRLRLVALLHSRPKMLDLMSWKVPKMKEVEILVWDGCLGNGTCNHIPPGSHIKGYDYQGPIRKTTSRMLSAQYDMCISIDHCRMQNWTVVPFILSNSFCKQRLSKTDWSWAHELILFVPKTRETFPSCRF